LSEGNREGGAQAGGIGRSHAAYTEGKGRDKRARQLQQMGRGGGNAVPPAWGGWVRCGTGEREGLGGPGVVVPMVLRIQLG
jgi:hypothetical protein